MEEDCNQVSWLISQHTKRHQVSGDRNMQRGERFPNLISTLVSKINVPY